MRIVGLALAPFALMLAAPAMMFSAPAAASDLIEASCDPVTDGDIEGCLYAGNINGQADPTNVNGFKFAEAEYNEWATANSHPTITLDWITKNDDANFGLFGTSTGFDATTGTFHLPGWDVDFYAVKFGAEFILFEYLDSAENPDGSYNWSIPGQNGMSHIAFFGSPTGVPEPGTWMMLLLGFAAAGYRLRRSRLRSGEVMQFA